MTAPRAAYRPAVGGQAQTSLCVCSEHLPGRKMMVTPGRRCLDEAAPDASLIEAGATQPIPSPRYHSWLRRAKVL